MSLGRPENDQVSLQELQDQYGQEYHQLTHEKKEEYLRQLQAFRHERQLREQQAIQKLGLEASADIRTTTQAVVESISSLPDRAGYAMMVFGAKTDYGGSAAPIDIVPECL